MNRDYELLAIAHVELDAAGLQGVIDGLKGRIAEAGEVTGVDYWGQRRLAYMVRKQTHGHFLLLSFTAPPEAIAGLQQFLRVTQHEQVIRHLIVVDEKRGTKPASKPLPGEEAPAERESEAEAMARAAAERAALEEAAMAAAQQGSEEPAAAVAESAAPAEEAAAPADEPVVSAADEAAPAADEEA